MLVGWGGNNGSTLSAGILANKLGLKWETKEGVHLSNYFGSLTQSSTVRLGLDERGNSVYIPFKHILPMVEPNDIVLGGWDISSLDLSQSMKRAKVLDIDLQRQLHDQMEQMKPLPSIYQPNFIAANQIDRADNIITGTKQQQLDVIRGHIRDFKTSNAVDKVIVLWTANTERFCAIEEGINDSAESLLESIQVSLSNLVYAIIMISFAVSKRGEEEISPSTIFAVASILEGCSYINGSPQNTFVPGVVELAEQRDVFIAGDDFKSGY